MLLQVVMMPSPGDDLARILASLGESLPRIFNREGLERQRVMDMIAANPEYGQQIAGQVRAATAEGALDASSPGLSAVGATLGLDMGNPESQALLASIAGTFPSTLEEEVSALATDQAVGLAASPMAQLTQQTLETVTRAQGEEAKTSILTNMNAQELQEMRARYNNPALLAQYENISTQAGIRGQEEIIESWGIMDQFLEQHPEFKWAFASGLVNTPFLDYMKFLEQMSLEERLAALKSTSDPLEQFAALMSIYADREEYENSIAAAIAAAPDDETATAIAERANAQNATIAPIASELGIEWPEQARSPEDPEKPMIFAIPRIFDEYTNSLEDAAVQSALGTAYEEVLTYAGLQLGHLTPGTPEWQEGRAAVLTEIRDEFPEFWNHLKASGGLGEFFVEVSNWIAQQGGEVPPGSVPEATTPPTPEEIAQAQEMVKQGQARTVGEALAAIARGVAGFATGVVRQSTTTTPRSPTERQ